MTNSENLENPIIYGRDCYKGGGGGLLGPSYTVQGVADLTFISDSCFRLISNIFVVLV